MKTITFICYDKYPKTTKFHIFKKRFSSLADVAKFLKVSRNKNSFNENSIVKIYQVMAQYVNN